MRLIDQIVPQRNGKGEIIAYVAQCQFVPAAKSLDALRGKLKSNGYTDSQIDRAVRNIK